MITLQVGKKYRFATKRMVKVAVGELVNIYQKSNFVAFVISDDLGTAKIGCHFDDLVICEEIC